jgi:hypothetical protein
MLVIRECVVLVLDGVQDDSTGFRLDMNAAITLAMAMGSHGVSGDLLIPLSGQLGLFLTCTLLKLLLLLLLLHCFLACTSDRSAWL